MNLSSYFFTPVACGASALLVFKRCGDDFVDRPETQIPSYPQANMPFSGPMKMALRCLRMSTFATVAGCIPHLSVHRGGKQQRSFGREYDGRQSVIGETVSKLR